MCGRPHLGSVRMEQYWIVIESSCRMLNSQALAEFGCMRSNRRVQKLEEQGAC